MTRAEAVDPDDPTPGSRTPARATPYRATPVARDATPSVPPAGSAYWRFYDEVVSAQLAAWAGGRPARVLDLSGQARLARELRDRGHEVLRVGAEPVAGTWGVVAERDAFGWLRPASVDAVVAESRALSTALATEQTVLDLVRVLRPGGRLLVCVDSLLTGLARLAELGRWPELADAPAADCVLVPDEDGVVRRCFRRDELVDLLTAGGLVVDWVRPRSVLTPAAVEQALAHGGTPALSHLVRTELSLASGHGSDGLGMRLLASARLPG